MDDKCVSGEGKAHAIDPRNHRTSCITVMQFQFYIAHYEKLEKTDFKDDKVSSVNKKTNRIFEDTCFSITEFV